MKLRRCNMINYNLFYDKKRIIICYVLLMLGTGVWQLADWYYGNEDPLWHLVFYFFAMPFLSFALGVLTGDDGKAWRIPFVAATLSALIYLFMGNGGLKFGDGALQLCIPSFIAAAAGVIIRRFILWRNRNNG